MHTSAHTVLYDPDGLIEAELPLDREPYECLVKALLAWTGEDGLTTRDLEQVGLQLTVHAGAVASDVRRRADQLPKDSGTRALAVVVLREAEGRLSVPIEGTVRCVQNRARLVRASTNAWTAWRPRAPRSCDHTLRTRHDHGPRQEDWHPQYVFLVTAFGQAMSDGRSGSRVLKRSIRRAPFRGRPWVWCQ